MNTLNAKSMSGKPVNEDVQKALHKRYYSMESEIYHYNYTSKPTAQQVSDDLAFGCKRITWMEELEGEQVQVVVTSKTTYRVNGFSYRAANFSKLVEALDLK